MKRTLPSAILIAALASTGHAASLTLEPVLGVTGKHFNEIRAAGSDTNGTYMLSTFSDGRLYYRETDTGDFVTALARIEDPDGFRFTYSMTFAPDFDTSGKMYVSYGNNADQHLIVEYTRSSGDPHSFDPASRRVVMTIQHPTRNNHYGGDIEFGPDGYLYVTTGDADLAPTDALLPSQDVTNRLGSVLRIDVTGDAFAEDDANNYAIPADNPDFGNGADPALFAIGLRNPYQATFDPETGRYFIADVGEDGFEEVNLGAAGANYGWNLFEGTTPFFDPGTADIAGTLTDPVLVYDHDLGQSITGGLVYRGAQGALADLVGHYIFGDFATGRIFSIDADVSPGRDPKITAYDLDLGPYELRGVLAFGTDTLGNLYVSDFYSRAFQITAVRFAAVPGPASGALLLSALLGGLAVRRGGRARLQG